MKKRIISFILALTTLSVSVVGCGTNDPRFKGMKTEEIIAAYDAMENNYLLANQQYNDLKNVYDSIMEQGPTSAISSIGDGTGKLTFNSVDSKIIFPESFKYPASQQTSASGSIDIVQNVSVTPGQNWICKLNGASLELEHSTGISGVIKVGTITDLYNQASLQDEVLAPWLSKLPKETIKYENIFVNGIAAGCQATTPTMIDSENSFLRCGMLGFGSYSITYVFVYRSLQDATKDESILNVLKSIYIAGNQVSIGA